jgi:hypothetical protein
MSKDIYGFMMTYNQMDWLPYACGQIDKMLEYNSVKKFFIAEGSHTKHFPWRSPDGSWDYLHDRYNGIEEVEIINGAMFKGKKGYVQAQWRLLGYMLDLIPRPSWALMLHDDQFMFDSFMKSIPDFRDECKDDFDLVLPRTMEFAFNTKLHWHKTQAGFLNKVYHDTEWFPISLLGRKKTGRYLKNTKRCLVVGDVSQPDTCLFHMGVAMKRRERAWMRVNLAAEKGSVSTRDYWYTYMFLGADLNNLNETYEKGRKYFGEPGFYKDSLDNKSPAIVQTLSTYDGLLPESIRNHPYAKIEDIRTVK